MWLNKQVVSDIVLAICMKWSDAEPIQLMLLKCKMQTLTSCKIWPQFTMYSNNRQFAIDICILKFWCSNELKFLSVFIPVTSIENAGYIVPLDMCYSIQFLVQFSLVPMHQFDLWMEKKSCSVWCWHLQNKQDTFLSSAKFVGIAKRHHPAATAYPRDVLYEKWVDFVT